MLDLRVLAVFAFGGVGVYGVHLQRRFDQKELELLKEFNYNASEPCRCLNWNSIYKNLGVPCGRAFELMDTSKEGDASEWGAEAKDWETPENWLYKVFEAWDHAHERGVDFNHPTCADFYYKMQNPACVKVSFDQGLYDEGTEPWYAKSWCLVSSSCKVPGQVYSIPGETRVSAKFCNRSQGDFLLSTLRPPELAGMATLLNMSMLSAAYGAYPVQPAPLFLNGTAKPNPIPRYVENYKGGVLIQRGADYMIRDEWNSIWGFDLTPTPQGWTAWGLHQESGGYEPGTVSGYGPLPLSYRAAMLIAYGKANDTVFTPR